jgi:glycosyltransferase involved in cell wall biosynthesis
MQHTVVDGQTGLLVTPGAPVALAHAIARVLGNTDVARQLGDAGRARALEHFTWDRAVDQLIEAYTGVAKARARR